VPVIAKGESVKVNCLAQKDKKYEFLSPNFQAVTYDDKTESKLPPEFFTYSKGNYVHFYINVHNYKLRYDEMDTLIRGEKFGFGKTVDVALIVEHTNCSREDFEYYAKKFDKLQADYPNVRFIFTTGISVPNGVKWDWMNMDSHGFAEEMRARYKGKAPLWDLQKMLNDNFRYGYGTCPKYSASITNDPNEINLHPSVPSGQLVTAKGFLLAVRDALRAPWPPKPLDPVTAGDRKYAPKSLEPIDADHPDAKAVRALLDANGLTNKKVEDVSVVKNGRIVKLYIMGMGVENLTSSIGDLTELKELLVYGFRSPWKLPLLKTVDPAIGKCAKLEVLALNINELATLPDSISKLTNLKILSVGDNHLQNLSPAVTDLVKRLDPRGVAQQTPPPSPQQVPSSADQPKSSAGATAQITATLASPPAKAGVTTKAMAAVDRDSLPMLPEKDPAATGEPVKLLPGLENKHPRLFLTAEQLPQLRAYYNSEAAADYRKQFQAALNSCAPPKICPPWPHGWVDGVNGIGRANMQTVALHYLLTGDKTSLARAKEYLQNLAGTANWATGGEPTVENTPEAYAKVLATMKKMPPHNDFYAPVQFAVNSDPHAAYMLAGAAVAWDWLYNDLDPVFREQFRQILWEHERALYYGGYMSGSSTRLGRQYWNAYMAYNHRSTMDMGLAIGTLAAAEGKPEEQWMLGNLKKEMDFLEGCLAPDGSQRVWDQPFCEAGMALQVADECLGTHHLDAPFIRNTSTFMLQATAPGMADRLFAANYPKQPANDQPYTLKFAAHFKQADQLDGIRQGLKKISGPFSEAGGLAWIFLIADDPKIQGGHYTNLPTTGFYPDLGLSFMRESWQDNAVAASIKCGPPGGYHYVSFRQSAPKAALGPLTQNFSHGSWPNANMFVIFGDGDYLAETERGGSGRTSSYNTIVINKIGQTEPWRHDGAEWEPWAKEDRVDVSKMAVITAYKDAGEVVVTEGEAAGSYGAYDDAKTKKSRPALDRFRRDFIWVKGGYILILDDVRAPQPVEITWLVQGAKLEPVEEEQRKYRLSQNKAHCDFQLLADTNFKMVIDVSTAAATSWTGKKLDWQQLQASAEAKALRFVSIYDPWHHQDLKLTFTPSGPDKATITVNGSGIADTWQWESAKGKFDAATIHGTRQQGFDVLVDAKTAVPPPHD